MHVTVQIGACHREQGAFFDRDTRVHTADGKAYVIRPEFVNDFENEDYNNAYYEVEVIGEE